MKCCSGEELAGLAVSEAIFIAKNKTNDDLTTLSSFFLMLSDVLGTIASQREICENNKSSDSIPDSSQQKNGDPERDRTVDL